MLTGLLSFFPGLYWLRSASVLALAQAIGFTQAVPPQDPAYLALRNGTLKETFPVRDLELKRDAGLIRLRTGKISLLQPVQDRVTMAIFRGDGEFSLAPEQPGEKVYLRLVTGKQNLQENFTEALLCFTDGTETEFRKLSPSALDEPPPQETLQRFRQRLRKQREEARSFLEAMLGGASVDNMEAEILTDLHNTSRPGFFSAYMAGRKYKDLRFHVRPRGALPDLPSAEEVALIHLDPGGDEEAILYLAHAAGQETVSVLEKSPVDAQHYKMDATIAGNRKLSATAEITFAAAASGDRVLKLGLEPTLRVSKAALDA